MRIKNFRKYYPAFIVLITMLSISMFAYYQANVSTLEKREKLFQGRVQGVRESINVRIIEYIQILKGCQGLFYASDTISARDWKVYIDNLKISSIYPGIQGIGYAPYILTANKTKLEQEIRNNGFPDFKIRSSFKNKHLVPTVYIEPFKGRNLRAFGFDMYSEKARRQAIDRALLTGNATITSKVILVQETSHDIQPGLLLYMPVYKRPIEVNSPAERKRNIAGFVYYPFRAYDLFETITNRYKDLRIRIYDEAPNRQNSLLFDSDSLKIPASSALHAEPEFYGRTKIDIAGRSWNILISSTDDFGSTTEKAQPILILIFGIILSILFYSMIHNIISRNTAMSLELKLTRDLDHKKDEFIGIASHELKTPLTSIKAYMQLLERADLQEKERTYVMKANSNISKLGNLIGDLLDVSKVQSGQLCLNVAPFELEQMISESVENVQHMYNTHRLTIAGEIPKLTLNGDILRLEQALTNILLNAIKYSPGANAVNITVSIVENQVKIDVSDSGIGISKDNQERIFERYYRAKELSPVLSGLGMGLFIAFEIVKRHNGTIEVNSQPAIGSTFSVLLPV